MPERPTTGHEHTSTSGGDDFYNGPVHVGEFPEDWAERRQTQLAAEATEPAQTTKRYFPAWLIP